MVPFMAIGYLLTALLLIFLNFDKLPAAIALIVASGCVPTESLAAALATPWHGACAARSLLLRLALVRVPLLLICMATGIMVFLTDSYHVKDAAGNMIVDQVPGAIAGPNVVQHAIDFSLLGWGSVAIAILLFAFTSQVFFFYVATTNLVFLLGEKRNIFLGNVVKVGALAISFIGCVITADAM